MKSALIVEDEKLSADRMIQLVQGHTSLQIVNVVYSVDSAVKWLDQNEVPDVIFLDIQLGDGTGFDILDHLLEANPFIIFTTAFDEYTLKAFKYNSVDYLLKPVKKEELIAAVNKYEKLTSSELSKKFEDLRRDILKDYKTKFLIKTGLKFRSVSVNEIAYFFSKEGTSFIKTKDGDSLMLDLSLESIETCIDPKLFFRVNRHLIVNGDSIQSIDSFFNGRLILEMKPIYDEDVIVSRDKVKPFKNWLDH